MDEQTHAETVERMQSARHWELMAADALTLRGQEVLLPPHSYAPSFAERHEHSDRGVDLWFRKPKTPGWRGVSVKRSENIRLENGWAPDLVFVAVEEHWMNHAHQPRVQVQYGATDKMVGFMRINPLLFHRMRWKWMGGRWCLFMPRDSLRIEPHAPEAEGHWCQEGQS